MGRRTLCSYVAAVFMFLSCAAASYAAESMEPRNGLQLELRSGGDLWGYGGQHCHLYQNWDGSGFTIETKVYFPTEGKPGRFPRESWYGIYVQDTNHGYRYTYGPVNVGWNMSPDTISLGSMIYEKSSNFKPTSGFYSISQEKGFVFLRLQFIPAKRTGDNGRLVGWAAAPGEDWVKVWDYKMAAEFAPNRIGLSVESFHGDYSYGPVTFEYFLIDGAFPARSSYFGEYWSLDGWEFALGKRIKLQYKEEAGGLKRQDENAIESKLVDAGQVRVDGIFADWDAIKMLPAEGFVNLEPGQRPYLTRVSSARDQHNLYFKINCLEEPSTDLLQGKKNGDLDWQEDDAVQIVLTAPSGEKSSYVFNSAGQRFTIFVPDASALEYAVATEIQPTAWSAEVAIPLGNEELPKPEAGDEWQIQVFRYYPNALAIMKWPATETQGWGKLIFD